MVEVYGLGFGVVIDLGPAAGLTGRCTPAPPPSENAGWIRPPGHLEHQCPILSLSSTPPQVGHLKPCDNRHVLLSEGKKAEAMRDWDPKCRSGLGFAGAQLKGIECTQLVGYSLQHGMGLIRRLALQRRLWPWLSEDSNSNHALRLRFVSIGATANGLKLVSRHPAICKRHPVASNLWRLRCQMLP